MGKTAAFVLAGLLLVPRAASAYFTGAEVTSIQGVYTSFNALSNAWTDSLSVLVLSTNTTDAADANAIWTQLALAEYRLSRGISYLFDINPDNPASACGANRAACVASADTEIASAVTALTSAKTTLTSCKTGGSTSWFRNACTAGETLMTTAITGADTTYDDALNYTSPNNSWFPQTIGPHGDFKTTIWHLVEGINVLRDGLDDMRRAWYWPGNSESVWGSSGSTTSSCTPTLTDQMCAWARLVRRMGDVGENFHFGLMTMNLVPYPNASSQEGDPSYHLRAGLSATQLVGNAYEFLLSNHSASQSRTHAVSGLAYGFDNFGIDSYVPLTEAMLTRTTSRGIFKPGWLKVTIKTWLHSDGAAWLSFEFPDEATLIALRAAKNPLNDPNGPPVTVAN